jgi:hypothetical protein
MGGVVVVEEGLGDEEEERTKVVQAAKKTKTCEGPRKKWVRGEKGVAMRSGGKDGWRKRGGEREGERVEGDFVV